MKSLNETFQSHFNFTIKVTLMNNECAHVHIQISQLVDNFRSFQ